MIAFPWVQLYIIIFIYLYIIMFVSVCIVKEVASLWVFSQLMVQSINVALVCVLLYDAPS